MSYPEVTAVIPGIKNIEQLNDHIENANFKLPEDIKQKFIEVFQAKIKDNPLYW